MKKTSVQKKTVVLSAAKKLLATGGLDALTTRAISSAAGIQPPVLYRLFGDMRGVMDALAFEVFNEYSEKKAVRTTTGDPIQDLRNGWDRHIEFGTENPELFLHVYANPVSGPASEVASEGLRHLRSLVEYLASDGLLALPIDEAVELIHAAAQGVILTVIKKRQLSTSADLSARLRDTVLDLIVVAPGRATSLVEDDPVVRHAVSLAVALQNDAKDMSTAEAQLLLEWLSRLSCQCR